MLPAERLSWEDRHMLLRDDLGAELSTTGPVHRVVSLVPSLTESIAVTAPHLLVGATDWCTHPADLDVSRVRGTKNPDVAAVISLAPDLVVANEEENRAEDVAELRAAGLAVWVTAPRTLEAAFRSLGQMLQACEVSRPDWLLAAERAWATAGADVAGPARHRRAFVPIWRRPWMSLGSDTFAGDVLSRLGVDHVYADDEQRYPRVTLDDVRRRAPDLAVLPDEPYAFTIEEGTEVFRDWGIPVAHVSGRHLTWYGPSLVEARDLLARQLQT
jgi:ABC-type Fe3+-hydroxamate transport system substrate-binding protein